LVTALPWGAPAIIAFLRGAVVKRRIILFFF
jgi:hypothetical protein